MKAATLDGLLPIHAARERHALRIFHERNEAYLLAHNDEMNTLLVIMRLQQHAKRALADVLGGGPMRAGDAQAVLERSAALERRVGELQESLENLSRRTQQALEAAREARSAYALHVRNGHKLREACNKEGRRRARHQTQRAEERADDDFSARWRRTAVHRSAA